VGAAQRPFGELVPCEALHRFGKRASFFVELEIHGICSSLQL